MKPTLTQVINLKSLIKSESIRYQKVMKKSTQTEVEF